MKKKLFLAMFVSMVTGMTAQNPAGTFSIKPMAGLNISDFSNATVDMYQTKVGFSGGAEMEYGLKNWLGISLGLMYSQQGAKIKSGMTNYIDEDGQMSVTAISMDGKIKCDYLNIPLMASIYLPPIKGLSLKAGVQMGILINDKMTTTVTVANEQSYPENSGLIINPDVHNHLGYKVNTSGVCKSVDFGIPVGLSYEFMNVSLDARYYWGLTKIDKTENPENVKNQYLSIALGYRFRL